MICDFKIGALALALAVSGSAFAAGDEASSSTDTDSIATQCEQEARDVGITDREEMREYIADCIEDMRRVPPQGGETMEKDMPSAKD